MNLKIGNGLKMEQVGEGIVVSLAPENTEEVEIQDFKDLSKLVAGEGIELVNDGKSVSIRLSYSEILAGDGFSDTLSLKPGTGFNLSNLSNKTITKEHVEKTIEKKGLKVKATDNKIEVSDQAQIKATKQKTRESYRPTAAQLELINEMALDPQTEDSGYVFELVSSSTDMDRSYEHMDNKAINDMVKMTPGKPFFLDHNWTTKSTMGRLIKAKNEGGKLIQWAYVPENSKTKEVIEEIFNGNLNRLSVGFSVDYSDMICDSCNKSVFDYDCEHYPGYPDEKGNIATVTIKRVKDFYEVSLVGVPCNPHAGTRKSLAEELSVKGCELASGASANLKAIGPSGQVGTIKSNESAGGDSGGGRITIVYNGDLVEKTVDSTIFSDNTIQGSDPVMEENKELEVQSLEQEETPAEDVAPEAPGEVEVPVEPKEEEKELTSPVEVKVEVPAELTEALVKLAETMEALKNGLEALDKKVDLAMTAPTKGLRDLLKNEQEVVKEEKPLSPMGIIEKFGLGIGLEDQQ